MSARSWRLTSSVSAAFLILALGSMSPSPALAALGDRLGTVTLDATANCTELFGTAEGTLPIGTSVAAVPGSRVGRPEPVLLVVSCFSSTSAAQKLFFVDPNSGTTVKTLTVTRASTTPAQPTLPNRGWGALAYRGDKADLLGCGNDSSETHAIWAINISVFDSIADGTAKFLFNAQPGFSICDGVAWDVSDNTVYQSPDVFATIYQFSETGALLRSFAAPVGCPNSGLAVGGGGLFAACNGDPTIHHLDKAAADPAASPLSESFMVTGRTEDLECDPVTFAPLTALWTKDAFPRNPNTGVAGQNEPQQIYASEIPPGACGFAGGPAVLTAAACLNPDGTINTTDTDGDGLLDCWEDGSLWEDGLPRIDFDGDGVPDLVLCVDENANGVFDAGECADKNHKDKFIEIDYMQDATHSHRPNSMAVSRVKNSFAVAPVSNPDGTQGIRLHVQVDEAVTHSARLAFEPITPAKTSTACPIGTQDFDEIKKARFGTAAERANPNTIGAKFQAFHYGIFAHNLCGSTSSGAAEVFGNDFVVSLGSFSGGVGTVDQQAGTLMHEFGHNLGLRHGGGDNTNCKPNYLSVQSYSRQFEGAPIRGRPLDFSRQQLASLIEGALTEGAGIGGPAGDQIAYNKAGTTTVVSSSGAINWDGDTGIDPSPVSADLNKLTTVGGCGTASPGETLEGYNDWANLAYNFRASFDFADGVHLSADEAPEQTHEEAEEMALAVGNMHFDALVDVTIDIKPGSFPNSINRRSNGVIPVAILSANGFDAPTQVDPATLSLEGAPVKVTGKTNKLHCGVEDVNFDGLPDLVCHMVTQQAVLPEPGDAVAVLTGKLKTGEPIRGEDVIRIVK